MTVRLRLTIAIVAVILVANCALSLVTVLYMGQIWLDEVQTRVRLNLGAARTVYNDRLREISLFLIGLSFNQQLSAGLRSPQCHGKQLVSPAEYQSSGLDFLTVVDAQGRAVFRAHNPQAYGDDLSSNPLVSRVLREGKSVKGTVIVDRSVLARDGEQFLARARFDPSNADDAQADTPQVHEDGMVMGAAAPVRDANGKLVGVLFGGCLLNRSYELVDTIRSQVFGNQFLHGVPVGTVTIFQDGLRISTNVLRDDGARAVGTRLRTEVYEKVVKRGETWAAPTRVLDRWYITAFEPLRDPEDRIIGALYVGLLQEPFTHRRNLLTGFFLAAVGSTTAASLVLLLVIVRRTLQPIGQIIAMCRRVIEGDISARVAVRPPGEMGVLCQHIDAMAEAIAQRQQQLQEATREQIGRSEKLAAIGRLAAGVAHEINNPLTGVLTFAHLMRNKPHLQQSDREDLDVIIRETTRAAGIVRGLLDFSRLRPGPKQPVNINDVVRRTIGLLGSQQLLRNIMVVEDFEENLPPVLGDVNQLQQVLVNLSLNACEAMPNGGTLMFTTTAAAGKVIVKLSDTGHGISRENLERVFEPFFTTKPPGKGTGLGLSVSYNIVQQHGGTMEVESIEGKGTTFSVILPAADVAPGAGAKEG